MTPNQKPIPRVVTKTYTHDDWTEMRISKDARGLITVQLEEADGVLDANGDFAPSREALLVTKARGVVFDLSEFIAAVKAAAVER